jgi:hypothetical protein
MGVRHQEASDTVSELRVESSLVTATVEGRPVTLSAQPISHGVWAAIEPQVTPDRQSLELAQLLEHTWEEPLVPDDLVRIGADEDVAAVAGAVAAEIERDPSTLLRFRGYGAGVANDDDAWRGGELPPLPPPARRPPDSVPKRFGASGIQTADGELVEVLVRAYRAFAD